MEQKYKIGSKDDTCVGETIVNMCKHCIATERDLANARKTNKDFQDIIKAKDKWIDKLLKACEVLGEDNLPMEVRDALNYPDIEEAEMSKGWELL